MFIGIWRAHSGPESTHLKYCAPTTPTPLRSDPAQSLRINQKDKCVIGELELILAIAE